MPKAQRRQPSAVIEQLLDTPHRFDFFQAVRWLERWSMQQEHLPSHEVLGRRIRFRNSLSLGFAPSELAKLDWQIRDDGHEFKPGDTLDADALARIARFELTPAFMGLLGINGALPMFYTEQLAQREMYQRDNAARAFLDIFQHRAVTLFYQAWRKHRLPLQFEQDRRKHFLPMVLAVAGMGQGALRDRLAARDGGVADDALAYYAGALQKRPVSAVTISRLISQYFRVPVKLDQFVGRWFTLPAAQQTSLGMANAALGGNALVGERVWQRDLRMRLTLGPMKRDRFARFLPGGPGERALRELLTLMTGVTLEYEVRLCLAASDVQAAQLGAQGGSGSLSSSDSGPRLGWDAFLTTRDNLQDRADAGYDIHALA
jgi:type VI secretion system protein ImpH